MKYIDPSGHCVTCAWIIELGTLFGTLPDYSGISTARQNRALIVDIGGYQSIELAAGIAVQSQYGWDDYIKENLHIGSDHRGIAKLGPDECNCDPRDPRQAIKGLAEKINKSVGPCTSCKPADILIVEALAQNAYPPGGVIEMLSDSRYRQSNGYLNWNLFFKDHPDTPPAQWQLLRMSNLKVKDWRLFQVLLYANDMEALKDLGWDAPPDVNDATIKYMQCVGQGGSNCNPPPNNTAP